MRVIGVSKSINPRLTPQFMPDIDPKDAAPNISTTNNLYPSPVECSFGYPSIIALSEPPFQHTRQEVAILPEMPIIERELYLFCTIIRVAEFALN